MPIKEVALDLTNFVLSNVNDAISFKPQLCYEVPAQDYGELRERYIAFTGTSMRKNKSRLYFLPTNISDELQQLNPSVPDSAKHVPRDGHVYYKNRLITELDYENVKRVELACAYIAYAIINKAAGVEVEPGSSSNNNNNNTDRLSGALASAMERRESSNSFSDLSGREESRDGSNPSPSDLKISPAEATAQALKRGGLIGFRELGYLVNITPWHFHRVFKVITGLTIREYGQLCTEFAKKNRDIMNACNKRVQELKSQGHVYQCFSDPDFLKEGSLKYEPTRNVVLLPQYFIDPNKSKEHKKMQKENKAFDGKCTQRVEARKRRGSIMSGRIRAASQSSVTSNSSIQDVLQVEPAFPSTPQMSPSDVRASLSASPVLHGAAGLSTLDSTVLKSTLANSRKNSLVAGSSATHLPSASGKIGKPKPVSSSSNVGHLRHLSDSSTGLDAKELSKLAAAAANNKAVPNVGAVQNTVTSPKVDFKFDIFGGEGNAAQRSVDSHHSQLPVSSSNGDFNYGLDELNPRAVSNFTTASSNGSFQLDFNDDVANNVLNPSDNGFYLAENHQPHSDNNTATTSVRGNSKSIETLPRESNSTFLGDFHPADLDDSSQLLMDLNALPDDGNMNQPFGIFANGPDIGGGGSFTKLPELGDSYVQHEQMSTGQSHLNASMMKPLGQDQPHHGRLQDDSLTSSLNYNNPSSYSRNRLNSAVAPMDDVNRMFLSGYSGETPHAAEPLESQSGNPTEQIVSAPIVSQPSTRDNTMGSTVTPDTILTAETNASTRDFDAKGSLAAFTNLGFDALSPGSSPTALDMGLPVFNGNLNSDFTGPSIEALMSSGNDATPHNF
ncbi:LAFA_0G13608g1_1 [Lachancea sp. 'fantastica']|nr:LAFA_0G13608g1_1 [Lachancea sp. 'fantastica']